MDEDTKTQNRPDEAKKPVAPKLSDSEVAELKKELGNYIKSAGGFRKGITKAQEARAKEIMKTLGLKEPKLD